LREKVEFLNKVRGCNLPKEIRFLELVGVFVILFSNSNKAT